MERWLSALLCRLENLSLDLEHHIQSQALGVYLQSQHREEEGEGPGASLAKLVTSCGFSETPAPKIG